MPTLSADGNTVEHVNKGPVHVHVSGTFGGGTFKLQFLDNGGTWRDIAGASYTEAADKYVELAPATTIRGVLSGATTPSLAYNFRG